MREPSRFLHVTHKHGLELKGLCLHCWALLQACFEAKYSLHSRLVKSMRHTREAGTHPFF